VTPGAPEVTALEEYYNAYTRAIVDGVAFYVENKGFGHGDFRSCFHAKSQSFFIFTLLFFRAKSQSLLMFHYGVIPFLYKPFATLREINIARKGKVFLFHFKYSIQFFCTQSSQRNRIKTFATLREK